MHFSDLSGMVFKYKARLIDWVFFSFGLVTFRRQLSLMPLPSDDLSVW